MSETPTRRTLVGRAAWIIEAGETECLECGNRGVEEPDYCALFDAPITDGRRCPACLGAEE